MTTSVHVLNLGPKGVSVRYQYLEEDRWVDGEEPSDKLYFQGSVIPTIFNRRRVVIEEIVDAS